MYDPLELSQKIEALVTKDTSKKYYRFRATGFYGGIATADTVGCNLRCKFCWSSSSVWNTSSTGEFYSSEQVTETLQNIAQTKRFTQMRISGGEPTIGRAHLLSLLTYINPTYFFILETNGILLGNDKTYVDDLAQFKNLHVRVCLKGSTPDEFSWLTGATQEGFTYQLQALEYLRDAHIRFNIALVSIKPGRQELFKKLAAMGLEHIMVEEEEITLYPQVRKRLEHEGILSYFQQKK